MASMAFWMRKSVTSFGRTWESTMMARWAAKSGMEGLAAGCDRRLISAPAAAGNAEPPARRKGRKGRRLWGVPPI
jgi:hypothetical protein